MTWENTCIRELQRNFDTLLGVVIDLNERVACLENGACKVTPNTENWEPLERMKRGDAQ